MDNHPIRILLYLQTYRNVRAILAYKKTIHQIFDMQLITNFLAQQPQNSIKYVFMKFLFNLQEILNKELIYLFTIAKQIIYKYMS